MAMKGAIKPDPILINKFDLLVIGMVSLTGVEISGLEDELVVIELPDRTVASGGFRKATEFSIKIPMHHEVEMLAMELWYRESQDPILPTYKKPCTLVHKSHTSNKSKNYTLIGVFPKKRTLPDLEMANDGELATVEWLMSVDDVFPL